VPGVRPVRVLLVEDEPHLAEMVRVGLVSEGFVVEVCGDGDEGLRIGTVGDFDVIVLAIMLPKVNGYDVLRRLRERGVWTPVLMLTAKDGEFDQADAFDLGADDYLTKPFSFVVFVARLRALQRRGAPERPVVLVAGDLVVDPARRRVCRGDTPITVTPREFGVLECLLRNKGVVVTKAQLLAAVWDAHYEGDVNIVEVYVGYLRRKVDVPFARKSIETVRGVGYLLVPDGG